MSERPILFSAPMIRAILEGRKTVTRRHVKGRPLVWLSQHNGFTPEFVALPENGLCPYGKPGDRLWVRETFCDDWMTTDGVYYRADGGLPADMFDAGCTWRPSIHMRRSLSRITLEITGVRVERLQDISEADAIAEGIHKPAGSQFWHSDFATQLPGETPQWAYRNLWESINGAGSWDANPWVFVIEFKRVAPAAQGEGHG